MDTFLAIQQLSTVSIILVGIFLTRRVRGGGGSEGAFITYYYLLMRILHELCIRNMLMINYKYALIN